MISITTLQAPLLSSKLSDPINIAFDLMEQNADHKHVSSDHDQNSMLKVICNQRDRFRARLRETEEVCLFFTMIILFLYVSSRGDKWACLAQTGNFLYGWGLVVIKALLVQVFIIYCKIICVHYV